MVHPRHLVINADDVEPFIHPADPAYQSQHVLGNETTGLHDLLLNRGTVAPRSGLGGGNHPDNDEIYYGVSGVCLVDLGGDPNTGEGGETFDLTSGSVVFIPAGTFHRLRNPSDEPFVLLTVWPQPATRGANGIHDRRLDEWGSGFRLRPDRELVTSKTSQRVVNRATNKDPLRS
ncbi:MAG TPA: cupin domain-containing protein [Candidatus Saccharimonadales bacterium]|nr:cupin domain-containing protein [Candidatus Saccharimonadales bacterium]